MGALEPSVAFVLEGSVFVELINDKKILKTKTFPIKISIKRKSLASTDCYNQIPFTF